MRIIFFGAIFMLSCVDPRVPGFTPEWRSDSKQENETPKTGDPNTQESLDLIDCGDKTVIVVCSPQKIRTDQAVIIIEDDCGGRMHIIDDAFVTKVCDMTGLWEQPEEPPEPPGPPNPPFGN